MARACRARACAAHATLAFVVGLAACGPITYVGEVRHASEAVDTARAARADEYAPYWWTLATEYLHKAREVAAHADFQGANRFGRLAAEAADKATEEARRAGRDPARRPLDVKPVAPAKDAPAKDAPAPARDKRPVAPAKDTP